MDNTQDVEYFLNLIKNASLNNIDVNANMVYGNLISYHVPSEENVAKYFKNIQDYFQDNLDIRIKKIDDLYYFLNGKLTQNNIKQVVKMYVGVDKKHYCESVKMIFDFLAYYKIRHQSIVRSKTRNDNIVIRVFNQEDAKKIENYVMDNPYIINGTYKSNPFVYNNGIIGYAWDGNLSYNMTVSKYISGYINYMKASNKLDMVGYASFINYIKTIIVNIEDPYLTQKYAFEFDNNDVCYMSDFVMISKMLYRALAYGNKVENFYSNYDKLISGNFNIEDKQTFQNTYDQIYKFMCEKYGIAKADQYILKFIETGDYSYFTREHNVRAFMVDNGIDQDGLLTLFSSSKDKIEKQEFLRKAVNLTYKKYDYNQVREAIIRGLNGDYSLFTNDDNCRVNLVNNILNGEMIGLIIDYLLIKGYSFEYIYNDKISFTDTYLDNVLGLNKDRGR